MAQPSQPPAYICERWGALSMLLSYVMWPPGRKNSATEPRKHEARECLCASAARPIDHCLALAHARRWPRPANSKPGGRHDATRQVARGLYRPQSPIRPAPAPGYAEGRLALHHRGDRLRDTGLRTGTFDAGRAAELSARQIGREAGAAASALRHMATAKTPVLAMRLRLQSPTQREARGDGTYSGI